MKKIFACAATTLLLFGTLSAMPAFAEETYANEQETEITEEVSIDPDLDTYDYAVPKTQNALKPPAANEWDGKTEMQPGKTYSVTNTLELKSDFTIPQGAKLDVKEGATLVLNSATASATIKGTLQIRKSGRFELIRGKANVVDKGQIALYGDMFTYVGTSFNIVGTKVTVFNTGFLKVSGETKSYSGSELRVRGEAVFSPKSEVRLTSSVTVENSGKFHVYGQFTTTTGNTFAVSGYMTIGRESVLKNSGKFTVEKNANYYRYGEFVNTKSGVFNDLRNKDTFGDFTVSLIVDEPEVKIKGIDVSFAQGDIDWKKVADSGVKFAIIRAARGTAGPAQPMKEDDYFRKNIEGATKNGIDVGVYFYSYASTVEQARKEAEFLVSIIKNYKITYPVVLDMEEKIDKPTETLSAMIEEFFGVLKNNGYYPMLYSYRTWLEKKLDMAILGKYAVWVAEIGDSTSYQGGYYIWQHSHKGKVPGINGDVDLDWSYRDFPVILKKIGANRLG